MKTPKKYGIGFKLFEMNSSGQLFPLFIGKNKETSIGKWIPAENLPTKNFSERPGWHCSMDTPDAPWLRGYDGSNLGPYKSRFKNGKRVWCEVLYDMTNDYREKALRQPKKCFEDKLPVDGFYWFKEGSRGTWVITSAIKINKILTEEEVDEILKEKEYDKVKAYAKYKMSFEKRLKIGA